MIVTIISTRDGTWRTVEWDEPSQSWRTVASGPQATEAVGDRMGPGGAYLPGDRREPLVSRGAR